MGSTSLLRNSSGGKSSAALVLARPQSGDFWEGTLTNRCRGSANDVVSGKRSVEQQARECLEKPTHHTTGKIKGQEQFPPECFFDVSAENKDCKAVEQQMKKVRVHELKRQ